MRNNITPENFDDNEDKIIPDNNNDDIEEDNNNDAPLDQQIDDYIEEQRRILSSLFGNN